MWKMETNPRVGCNGEMVSRLTTNQAILGSSPSYASRWFSFFLFSTIFKITIDFCPCSLGYECMRAVRGFLQVLRLLIYHSSAIQ